MSEIRNIYVYKIRVFTPGDPVDPVLSVDGDDVEDPCPLTTATVINTTNNLETILFYYFCISSHALLYTPLTSKIPLFPKTDIYKRLE